jgi:hypothetical protein
MFNRFFFLFFLFFFTLSFGEIRNHMGFLVIFANFNYEIYVSTKINNYRGKKKSPKLPAICNIVP